MKTGIIVLVVAILAIVIGGFFIFNGGDSMIEETEEVAEEEESVEEEESLINGKTLEERLDEARAILHQPGSEEHVRDNFPDIELVFVDPAVGGGHPNNILPFEYYYSEEADVTFNICAIERTVMICDGVVDWVVTNDQIDSGLCQVIPIYQSADTRL